MQIKYCKKNTQKIKRKNNIQKKGGEKYINISGVILEHTLTRVRVSDKHFIVSEASGIGDRRR
jgi:hypothetical protein